MTTIELELPDDLAEDAKAAGLLNAEALEEILRERLRFQAGKALRAQWNRASSEKITTEIDASILEIVAKVRGV